MADFDRHEHLGFTILVGRTAADNDRLTFKTASQRDHWLHVAGRPGSHVVVSLPDGIDAAPGEVLEVAARLAAWHSKARGAGGKVEVHHCRAGDVRKPRGWPPGKVRLTRFSALKVYVREPPAAAVPG